MEFEEKTLKRESKFKGHIFEVAVDEVLLPDGRRLVVNSSSTREQWLF